MNGIRYLTCPAQIKFALGHLRRASRKDTLTAAIRNCKCDEYILHKLHAVYATYQAIIIFKLRYDREDTEGAGWNWFGITP